MNTIRNRMLEVNPAYIDGCAQEGILILEGNFESGVLQFSEVVFYPKKWKAQKDWRKVLRQFESKDLAKAVRSFNRFVFMSKEAKGYGAK